MRDDAHALIGPHELKEILDKNIQALARRCGSRAVQILVDRLKETLETPEADKYSYVWRNAIEDHEQNQTYEDTRSIFLNGARDALLLLALENPSEAAPIVRQLLQSEFSTLQRLGIYACGERYQGVGKEIWIQFNDLWLSDSSYWHEIWWFLKKAFPYISKDKSLHDRVLTSILSEQKNQRVEVDAEAEKYNALRIRGLLSAIQGLGDSEVDAKYKQVVEKLGRESDHPDFHFYHSGGGFVADKSPLSVEELLKLTPDQLIDYLNSYKPAQGWREPNEEGLGNALQKAIQDYPEKYDAMLERFMGVSVVYQHYVFRAFSERFKERKKLPWDQILNLAHRVVAQDDFLRQLIRPVSDGFKPNPRWLVSDIADLINGATKDDERPIPPDAMQSASSLLRTLLRVMPSDAEAKESDAMSQAINTSRGRLLEAFIALSLQRARFAHKAQGNHEDVWSDIRLVFDQELALSLEGKSYEFSTLAVTYLPNFHYLDSDWVKHNFEKVFPLDKPAIWRCAAQGFAYIQAYHTWLFELLRTGGHLERMLQLDMDRGHLCEKALQYLAIAYLNGKENLGAPHGLLRRVIVELREAHIKHLCWFFWTFRKSGLAKPERQRIIDLWGLISDKVKGREAQHKAILSAASLLAEFFEDISPTAEVLWTQAAAYADEAHHGYTFVEHLAIHASTSPAAVARVFLAALTNGFVPTYDPKDIHTCVERLFQAGETKAAVSICELYERKGQRDLLRPLYDKYREQR